MRDKKFRVGGVRRAGMVQWPPIRVEVRGTSEGPYVVIGVDGEFEGATFMLDRTQVGRLSKRLSEADAYLRRHADRPSSNEEER